MGVQPVGHRRASARSHAHRLRADGRPALAQRRRPRGAVHVPRPQRRAHHAVHFAAQDEHQHHGVQALSGRPRERLLLDRRRRGLRGVGRHQPQGTARNRTRRLCATHARRRRRAQGGERRQLNLPEPRDAPLALLASRASFASRASIAQHEQRVPFKLDASSGVPLRGKPCFPCGARPHDKTRRQACRSIRPLIRPTTL
ncbi:protein of unknown function [Paraburkholderia kururiensis]